MEQKFEVGNKVKATSRLGSGVGVITEVSGADEFINYTVMLEGEHRARIYYKKNLELLADEVYAESVEEGMPKFRPRDVVYDINSPNKTNVAIMEAVSQDDATGEYKYKAAYTYDGSIIDQFDESELSYLYHDEEREIHKK